MLKHTQALTEEPIPTNSTSPISGIKNLGKIKITWSKIL